MKKNEVTLPTPWICLVDLPCGFALRVHLAQLAQCIPTVCRACAERACADLQDLQDLQELQELLAIA